MENIEISKAAAIDKLPGRFLKDGNEILSKPVSEICNLSVSHWIFPNPCEVEKISLILKKDKKKSTHEITGHWLFVTRYCHRFQKSLRK